MADKKITQLTDGGAPQATDEFVVARGGDNFKVDYAAIETEVRSDVVVDGDAAGGVLSGTYPNPGFAVDMATQAELDAFAAQAVILAPASSARNVVIPTAGTVITQIWKAHASQSVDLTQWQTSAGVPLVTVGPTGAVTISPSAGFTDALQAKYVSGETAFSVGSHIFGAEFDLRPAELDGFVVASIGQSVILQMLSDPVFANSYFQTGAVKHGFNNANPVAQQAASTISDLWTAFKNYGLLTAGSTAPTLPPSTATYITQTPDAGLSAEQALSALATGLLKNTTTTGVLSIAAQGTDYYAPGGTDVALADGGTGASLADPNADRILFWDDSAGAVTWLAPGTGLAITTTTIDNTGYVPGGTDVAVADGGTGSSTAGGARTNLDVPSNAEAILDAIMDAKGDILAASAADTVARVAVGGNGRTLYADSSVSTGVAWADPLLNPARPTGALAETFWRQTAGGIDIGILVSSRLQLFPIILPAGLTITSISVLSGATPLSAGTHQIFGLFDAATAHEGGSARALLRGTSDDTSTAWSANVIKTLNLTSTYQTVAAGYFYLGVLVTATTPPTLRGLSATGNNILQGLAPVLNGASDTAITALPNPAAAPTASTGLAYAYVS